MWFSGFGEVLFSAPQIAGPRIELRLRVGRCAELRDTFTLAVCNTCEALNPLPADGGGGGGGGGGAGDGWWPHPCAHGVAPRIVSGIVSRPDRMHTRYQYAAVSCSGSPCASF